MQQSTVRRFGWQLCGFGLLVLVAGACGATDGAAGVPDVVSDTALGELAGTDAATTDAAGTDAAADAPIGTDATGPDVADVAVLDVQPDSAGDAVVPNNCGGKTSVACPDGSYCAVAQGQCGAIGQCAVKPQVCDMIYAPVCGCDGKTYSNSCDAASNGQNVNTTGACPTNNTCGGFVGKPCSNPSDFCDPDGCGADMMGVCVSVPSGCPKNLAPVCGCDGKTYGNDCMRQAAGVGKASNGACPVSCTIGNASTCGKSQMCQAATVGMCSGKGACVGIPAPCPAIVAPVCGCDGVTYDNGCQANNAGTNVASDGKCSGSGACVTTKDCTGGLACKSGVCGACPGIMCTAIACPSGQTKDQCCQCYTP